MHIAIYSLQSESNIFTCSVDLKIYTHPEDIGMKDIDILIYDLPLYNLSKKTVHTENWQNPQFSYRYILVLEAAEVRKNFGAQDLPSPDAIQIASNLSNLGQIYNREDLSTDVVVSMNSEIISYFCQVNTNN